jgi:hypothetical protein
MKFPGLSLAAALAVVGSALVSAALPGQSAGEAFTATASVKSDGGGATAPVRISIERFATEAERAAIVGTVKSGGTPAVRAALAKTKDAGTIEVGGRKTPIKYAYANPTGSGRIVTVVTAEPILHLGAGLPDAKPKAGYDLGVALLILDASGAGEGELAPAAKVGTNEAGAIVISDYGDAKIWLKGVAKAK